VILTSPWLDYDRKGNNEQRSRPHTSKMEIKNMSDQEAAPEAEEVSALRSLSSLAETGASEGEELPEEVMALGRQPLPASENAPPDTTAEGPVSPTEPSTPDLETPSENLPEDASESGLPAP